MYKPANHHYIPQLLLRNFCDGGQLWAGDKDTKRVFSPNPKNIFAEHNLNIDHDLEDIDIKDDKAEKLLGKIENAAKKVINEIIEKGRRRQSPRLSSGEQDSWKRFYLTMCRRTPEFIMKDLLNDERFEDAWIKAIEHVCAFTDSIDSQSVLSSGNEEILKIKDAVRQNNKARFASGDHRLLQEEDEQFCLNTGILIAVIDVPKRSFVIGSSGITTVNSGEARGSWLPVSPDVAVMPTPYPDREILWTLDRSKEHVIKRINMSTSQQNRFIAGRSQTLVRSLIEV